MDLRTTDHDETDVPRRARRLLGDRTGLVNRLFHYLPDRSDPRIFHTTMVKPDLEPLPGTRGDIDLEAGGKGLTSYESVMSCIGETIERYCLLFPDENQMVEASYRELVEAGREVVDFEYLRVHEPEHCDGLALEPIERDDTVKWQPMLNLLDGETVLVPSQLVWLQLDDDPHFLRTSSGCAAHGSLEAALVGGLSELVERDALMRTWYSRRPTRSVDLSEWPAVERLCEDRFTNDQRSVHVFEVDAAIDTTVAGCAMVDRRDRAPKFVVSSGESIDPREAYVEAMVEMAQSWTFVKDEFSTGVELPDLDPDRFYSMTENLAYYAFPETFERVSFLLGDEPTDTSRRDDVPDADGTSLDAYLDRLEAAGVTPLAVDVTTSDAREGGFHVVQTFVPELVRLTPPSLPPIGHPRLDADEAVTSPHPFP